MSNLRRQTRDSSWQWVLVGVLLGLAAAAVACLGSYAAGLITLNVGPASPQVDELAQPTVLVSEVAELPTATATREPQIVIVTATSSGMTVIQPSATPLSPTPDPNLATETEQPAPTREPIGTPLATPTPTTEPSRVDPVLQALATSLELVSGGDFTMGTTQAEAAAAVSQCVNEQAGNCLLSYAEDSFPPHRAIVDSFQMERTEVVVAQYVAFLNTLGPNSHLNGCGQQPCAATNAEEETSRILFDGTEYSVDDLFAQLPMTHVTWYGASSYCEALDRRLPTEAEWERAARGTDSRVYPWGNTWIETNANTNRPLSNGPVQVGSYPEGASPFGILDMAGNVGEWVNDWYQGNYYAQPEATGLNPQGPAVGTSKVARGGHWDAMPFFARTMHRQDFEPNTQTLRVGFRCVSDEAPVQPAGPIVPTQPGQVAPTATIAPPTRNPNITPSPLPSLPPGG